MDITQNLDRSKLDPDAEMAAVALGEMFQNWEFERMRSGRHLPVPDIWKGHLFDAGSNLFFTPEEADSFAASFQQLIAPLHRAHHRVCTTSRDGRTRTRFHGHNPGPRSQAQGHQAMKALFSISVFRRFTGAWSNDNHADSALFLTLSIWVTDTSGSSGAAGMVFLALGLPIVLFPLIGALADRSPRRRLLIVGNVVAAAIALGVIGLSSSALFKMIEKALGREPEFFGVLMSLQRALSILGGLTAAMLMRGVGPARAVGLGLEMIALATLAPASNLLPFFAHPGFLLALVLPAHFLAGVGVPWRFVALVTIRQRLTPAQLQGRAAATNMVLNIPQLLSTAAGALLVGLVDYRWLMLVAAVVIAECALSMLRGEREPRQDTPAPVADASRRN